MTADRMDQLLDSLSGLAQPGKGDPFREIVQPAFAGFEAIHQNYIQSFQKYRTLLSDKGESIPAIIDQIRTECLFTEHQRIKLRQLSQTLSNETVDYNPFFHKVYAYLTTSHDIDHATYPPDYFSSFGQRWFHGLGDSLVALQALARGEMDNENQLPAIRQLAQNALEMAKDERRAAISLIDEYANQLQMEYSLVCEEYSRLLGGRQAKWNVQDAENLRADREVNILFLAADPVNADRLRLGEEAREIQEKLQLAQMRDLFHIEQRWSVRPEDLTQAMLDVRPDIVHFSGHGTGVGALCLEDQTGRVQPVEPDTLTALFELMAHQVQCVLLNACYSEKQARAIARHIRYVIGMNQAIGDRAAIAFAAGFYQALGGGRSIEDAYKFGCVQIRLQGIPEHLTPVLVKKPKRRGSS